MWNKRFKWMVLSLLMSFVPFLTGAADPPIKQSQITQRFIVGGTEATPGAWPWMVSIQAFESHYCGGTLIAAKWVLTAAHCEVSINDTVLLGVHDLSVDQGERIEIEQVYNFPGYNAGTTDSDIALLKLKQASNQTPIALNQNTSLLNEGTLVTTTGWGALSSGGASPDRLQQVTVPLVSQSTCNQIDYYNGQITGNMVCAGFADGGKDSCQGDSGGPLVLQDGSDWKIVGIVSWGKGCAEPKKPGVYTNLINFLDWVNQTKSDFDYSISHQRVEFPNVTVGNTSDAQTVTFSNTSSAQSLTISNISLGGQDSADFQISTDQCSSQTVSAQGTCQFDITFSPLSTGIKEATVSFSISDSTNLETITIPLVGGSIIQEALDVSTLSWSTGGNANWFLQSSVTNDGTDALQNGDIDDSETIWIETTVEGPGKLEFYWKVSSESGYDFFQFSLNGEMVTQISGSSDWQLVQQTIAVGTHTVRWSYNKDSAISSGDDAAWLDQVTFNTILLYSLSQQQLEFPNIDVGNSSDPQTITLTNTSSSQAATVASVNLTGQDANDFQLSSDQCTGQTLQAQGTCQFDVTFQPLSSGGKLAIVTINVSDSSSQETITIPIIAGNIFQEALDHTNLSWSPGGDADWGLQSTITYDGQDALQSGPIENSETIWLETTVDGPGTLEFYWKVSSEEDYDFFQFSINGEISHQISGNLDWQLITKSIPNGTQTLRWAYTKDVSNFSGDDTAWLDQVVFISKSISLQKGWNLIASKEFVSKAIGDFFSTRNFSTTTKPYHSIWTWDATTSNWKIHLADMTVEEFNQTNGVQFGEITTIQPGVGYWINMKESATFSYTINSSTQ